MTTTIECSVANGVMTVLLNRPEKLNAFNSAMKNELLGAIDEADANDAIRVILFTGAGRAFCAGGEIPEQTPRIDHVHAGEGVSSVTRADDFTRDEGGVVALRLYSCLKPIIAAVNGAAIGFGSTMLLPMDIRLGSTKARFGFPFAALGSLPEAASSWFLPRAVGMSNALEWCLTGEILSADQALKCGLLRSLHEPENLLESANELAHKIAAKASPVSAAVTRHMLWRLSACDHPMTAHIVESQLLHDRMLGADMAEGIRGFREKRPPNFPDCVSKDMPASFPWWQEPRFE
jgi:enoyl-CoA hydratase/carnithine racemase